MDVKAKLRFYRQSPRKVRTVVDVIRGMHVNDALAQLSNMNKKAALAVSKLIKSAVANAKNITVNNIDEEKLQIKEIKVDEGPTYKRYMPRARGRATLIRKKTSHISVILSDFIEDVKEKTAKKEEEDVKSSKKEEKPKTKQTKVDKTKKTSNKSAKKEDNK